MSKFETAKMLWQTDKLSVFGPVFHMLQRKGLLNWMGDKFFLKCAFRFSMGYSLNLKNPKTFNEKLQWLKLYDYKPEYDNLVDKYEVKKYISEKIGSEYVVPTYGVWNSVDEIDWNSLPNQFVIKTTHGSGGHDVFICRDKSIFDIEDCKAKLRLSMSQNTYWFGRERPYKNLKPRIMAEELLVAKCGDIEDYKVHSFNGIPEFLLVCRDRYSELGLTEDFFTDKWEHLDVKRPTHPNASVNISRPKELDEMLELAERLSKGIPFVRSDFYVAASKVYFGELTFYPASGFVPFEPEEWDEKWGKLITLPNCVCGGVYC